jgi:hypothetical protein
MYASVTDAKDAIRNAQTLEERKRQADGGGQETPTIRRKPNEDGQDPQARKTRGPHPSGTAGY